MLSYRFNQPPGTQSGDAITQELAAQNDHNTEAGLQGKTIQFGSLNNIGGIGGPLQHVNPLLLSLSDAVWNVPKHNTGETSGKTYTYKAKGNIRHNSNKGMFLDVEMPVRIQAADGQQMSKKDAYRVCNQLRDQRNYVDAWVA